MELELSWLFNLPLLISIFFLLFTKTIIKKYANPKNLPPSPPASLPIIGHLHLLKEPLHRTLHHMARKYGDVLLLRFGTRNVVVVSSYSATEECFTKNDVAFSNRPQSLAGKHLNYNHKTIGFSNYNDHWRILRRLTATELLSTARIMMFAGSREEEARLMVKQIFQERQQFSSTNYESHSKWIKAELRPKIVDFVFNIMMKMVAGKRYYGNGIVEEEARQFQSIMRDISELLGSSNINDFLPFLQWIDFQGVEKRMISVKEKMDRFFQSLVDEHRKIMRKAESGENGNERNKSFVDVILSLQDSNSEAYDDETIKGLMLAMLLAGTDTAVITIEWAMSLLLNHPEVMQKAWEEIDAKVGHEHLGDESDFSNLNYLNSVINETFRLFPGVPVILPRESSDDCTLSGFDIPKGTIVLINAWSIHRDEKQWDDATSFSPERFGEDGADGNKLLMFGGGRRICPGGLLARRVVCLGLGCLLQSFEWKRIGSEAIDLEEEPGLSMCKLQPLEALCKPRQAMVHTLGIL